MMTRELRCLSCRHFQPHEPRGWKRPDYAGADPFYFTTALLRAYLFHRSEEIAEGGWPGQCLSAPQPAEVTSAHKCGWWAANPDMIEGMSQWNRFAELRTENEELKKKLKQERERSLERFHLLQAKKKPKGGKLTLDVTAAHVPDVPHG